MDKNIILAELKETKVDTVVKRYLDAKKDALAQIKKTFDTQLRLNSYEVKIGVI